MTRNKPSAEHAINTDLVETLLNEFLDELRNEPVEFLGAGWDNELYRVGTEHVARLPRREAAAQLIKHEHEWLAELAETLPLPVPVPIHTGKPAFGFPWPWSLVPWLPGIPLAHAPAMSNDALMTELADFLNALHVTAPPAAPTNPSRGTQLAERAESVIENIVRCESEFEMLAITTEQVKDLWIDLVDAPEFGGEPIWLHGDFHPLNILVRNGQLSAVLDFGDLCAGDPATDLAIAWTLFEKESDRLAFRKLLTIDGRSVDVHTWKRARGCALALGLTYLANSADDPTLRRIGAATLENALS